MAGWATDQESLRALVRDELRSLRRKLPVIHGSLVATSDGMLIADDFPGAEPARLAALVSTTLGLAKQAIRETGRGDFREALARGTTGYMMVYAAGPGAVVAIIADDRVQAGLLQYEARETIAAVTEFSAGFASWSNSQPQAIAAMDQFRQADEQDEVQ